MAAIDKALQHEKSPRACRWRLTNARVSAVIAIEQLRDREAF